MGKECGCKIETVKNWLGADEFGNRYGVDVQKISYCPLHAAADALLEAARLALGELTEWNEGHESSEAQIELKAAIKAAAQKGGRT